MNEATERMYRWYVLGCRLDERQPMSREEFVDQQLLQLLSGGLFASEIFNRTSAEWELAREDAAWTTILQRLSKMNLTTESADLVTAIRSGRGAASIRLDGGAEDGGDIGSAGVPAFLPPFLPVLAGAGAKLHPAVDPEPQWRDP